jgi:peptidyl-prolyl cis-trans isomerase SurA
MKRVKTQAMEVSRPMRAVSCVRPFQKVLVWVLGFVSVAIFGCQKAHDLNVIASVNGDAIWRSELDRLYRTQQTENGTQGESQDQADTERLAILDDLIDQTILQQRAARMNLMANDEEVDIKLHSIKEQYSEAEFTQLLQESNQTIGDLRRDVRRYLTLDRLLNKEINSKISVTDADVERYFNTHQAQYNSAEVRYRIGQIVVKGLGGVSAFTPQGAAPGSETAARKRIEFLKGRVDAGEDFSVVAIRYSMDRSAQTSGGIGFLSESQLRSDPETYEAVSKLRIGQVSDILQVIPKTITEPVCYKILKLIARDVAGRRSLDPLVQQEIHDQIRSERSQLLQVAYFQTLRDGSKIENHLAEEILSRGAR